MAMFARNQRFQKLVGGGFLERTYLNTITGVQMFFLGMHKDRETIRMIRRVRRERHSLLTGYESYIVYTFARGLSKRPGEMAEVGVFRGGSAKLLCEAKGDKPLHLFDTFEGLPQASSPDGKVHNVGQYTCSLESVQEYLKDYPEVHLYKGCFPETAGAIADRQFCFAHFDVDLYDSTKACLEFFYSRMTPGGVMISHDYSLLAGVRQAFDEFFADKPDPVVELPSTQCMVIKLG
jgi:O-methyltransferase